MDTDSSNMSKSRDKNINMSGSSSNVDRGSELARQNIGPREK